MENEYKEYVTFTTTTNTGEEVEMAVVDEFVFEDKHYVVGALIKDDVIQADGSYIYESIIEGEEFRVEKIKREFDYKRIAQAYMHMEE